MPWEGVVIVFGLFSLTSFLPRKLICGFLGIIVVLSIITTHSHRTDISHFYESVTEINKNMISTLLYYKDKLNKEDYIGIAGIKGLSPWADDEYLHRNFRLKSKWIIFVDKSTIFFIINANDNLDPNKRINVLSMKKICDFPQLKYLYFNDNGRGKFIDNCRTISSVSKVGG